VTFIPFPEYRPDVNDYQGSHTQVLSGVLPRGDGWGPVANLQAYTQVLPAACRGFFYARKTDGTITVFAATSNRLFTLNNTTLGWTPVSKVVALTSISNASPAVFTLAAHGLAVGDSLVLSTSGALPTGLTAGTVYYVIAAGLTSGAFEVSVTPGGTAVATSSAGSGTHSMTYLYSALPSTDQWAFAQFGDTVVAAQANTTPQAFVLSTSSAFADLGGSPPAAKSVAVVGRFLVLSGLTSNLRRVQWSDLDNIIQWTAGTGFSNTVDLPDGGVVRGVAGGEFGVIFQESVIRRMVYVPGAKPAFQIERVTEDKGLLGTYSIARAGEKIFFVTQQGFYEYEPATGLVPIGKERVDRTFLADVDLASTLLLIGASDPSGTRAYWAYKSVRSSNAAAFDTIIAYDYGLQRWSPPLAVSGEFLSSMVKPGLTLEGLDTISSNVDTLSFSLDSVQSALVSKLASVTTGHALGFFDGANIEAVLETPEQGLEGMSARVRGFEPRTDAPTVQGSIRWRWAPQAALTQTTETVMDAFGVVSVNVATKLARARVRIPAGTAWTYCMGVSPDFVGTGKR
jgi:hypothetical protein